MGGELAGVTKRVFLRLASGFVAFALLDICSVRGARALTGQPSRSPGSDPGTRHLPTLTVPSFTRNGAHVPIVVAMAEPMEAGHYIKTLHILNDGDPIPSKGTFHLSPANGQAYLGIQARMRSGTSSVTVIAECTRHGRLVERRPITIPEGAEGCASVRAGEEARVEEDEIRPPVIRIPALVSRGKIRRGETIQVQLQFKHPNRTGLALREGKYVQASAPFFTKAMEVFYGGQLVSRLEMTPAVSDNPLITFTLRAMEEERLRVVLVDSLGRQFQATEEIVLS